MPKRRGKIVLVTTPKGGSGKTTITRLLLSEAARTMDCFGIDLDPQKHLLRWSGRRDHVGTIEPSIARVRVEAMDIQDYRRVIAAGHQNELTVIDTPPGVEHYIAAMDALQEAADLVVVPSGCTQDDADVCGDWARTASELNRNTVVVMNRADRRRRSYAEIQAQLLECCAVSPVEIPSSEDIPTPFSRGLAPSDFTTGRLAARNASRALWLYVRRELGL